MNKRYNKDEQNKILNRTEINKTTIKMNKTK